MNYKKGMELINKNTKEKIFFGKWNEDGKAACITKKNVFLTLTKEELAIDYLNPKEIEKKAKEKRRGQAW